MQTFLFFRSLLGLQCNDIARRQARIMEGKGILQHRSAGRNQLLLSRRQPAERSKLVFELRHGPHGSEIVKYNGFSVWDLDRQNKLALLGQALTALALAILSRLTSGMAGGGGMAWK